MSPQVVRIRMLNDLLRRQGRGGLLVVTRGIRVLRDEVVCAIGDAVAAFDAFTGENDPYDEHDFGAVEVAGHVVFFKIDTFDLDMHGASPDPSDPAVTRRVLTIMLAEEY